MLFIRFAVPGDAETIRRFIHELAVYEQKWDVVNATPEMLRAQLSDPRPPFECLLAEEDGQAVGFAVFFQNYSTWEGRPGLHLEDLFVRPEYRSMGIGKALLQRLAGIACERGYARIDWEVLDWNRSAHEFYRSLGATPMDDWTAWRLSGEALVKLATA